MRFALVEFVHEKTTSVIQESWFNENRDKCFFPPVNKYKNVIEKEINQEKIVKWKSFEILIIRDEIGKMYFFCIVIHFKSFFFF